MNAFQIGVLNYDFVVKQNKIPTLLGFISWWDRVGVNTDCALRYAAKRFDGRIWVGIVDFDYCAEVFYRHKVSQMPTFIMFENGVEVKRYEGFKSSEDVDRFVLDYLGLADEDVPDVFD